eukprot:scaffold261218_cov23-Tisochrysis_lutea.AAC.1
MDCRCLVNEGASDEQHKKAGLKTQKGTCLVHGGACNEQQKARCPPYLMKVNLNRFSPLSEHQVG